MPWCRLRLTRAIAGLFEEAWDGYFSGRITTGELQRSLAPDCDNARAALALANCAESTRLKILAFLQRALPRELVSEQLAHADACERLLESEPSRHLRMVGWLSIAITWLKTRLQRSRAAAERALALSREHERLTGDRRYLYAALGISAYAMALNNELDSASALLAELRGLEDAATVPRHLMLREDVESVIAGAHGDHALYRRLMRERIARAADAHDETIGMNNLIDAELAAGDIGAAAATGRTLVAKLASSRDEYQLTMARLNLCAALLALDAVAEARVVAKAGWPRAEHFELQKEWADYLALLAALEQRDDAAARLCGYSVAGYAEVEEPREVNEAAAFARAGRLAAGALGDTEFERLQAEGRSLRHDEIEAIAFGARVADRAPSGE